MVRVQAHPLSPLPISSLAFRMLIVTEETKKPTKLPQVEAIFSGENNSNQAKVIKTTKSPEIRPPERFILPAVPIREGVLFPSTESVLTFGRQISLSSINQVTPKQNSVVLITQKRPDVEEPKAEDMYSIGTLALVDKKIKTDESINALVRGIGRVKIIRFIQLSPKMLVEVEKLQDIEQKDEESAALTNHLQKEFRRAVHMGKPVEFLNFMKLMGGVTDGELTDQIASTLNVETSEKQSILDLYRKQLINSKDVEDQLSKIINERAALENRQKELKNALNTTTNEVNRKKDVIMLLDDLKQKISGEITWETKRSIINSIIS